MNDDEAFEPGRSPIYVRLLYTDPHDVDHAAVERILAIRLPGAVVTRDARGVVQIAGPARLDIDQRSAPALDLETTGHYLYDLAVGHVLAGPAAHVQCACRSQTASRSTGRTARSRPAGTRWRPCPRGAA